MEIVILLALLICPLTMGALMLWMMKGMRSGHDVGKSGRDVTEP